MKQRKFDPTLDVAKANIGSHDFYCETKPTKFYALTSDQIIRTIFYHLFLKITTTFRRSGLTVSG